ncbi:MAG: AMP-binding protein [Alphaproteobacteria bacterium]
MEPQHQNYQELYRDFRWDIPSRFNIGVDICDKWAASERTALILQTSQGPADRYSFADLKRLSNQLANVLATRGISRGDRVALLLPQSLETVVSHIAVYKLGAIVVPLAMLFGIEGVRYRLDNAQAAALITNAAGIAKITEIRDTLPALKLVLQVDGCSPDTVDFHAALRNESDSFTCADTSPDDPAVMVYTSGTTGPPKGALHGHRVLLGHLPGVQFTHDFFPQPGDVMWTPSDWAWAGGLFNILLPGLHFGRAVVAGTAAKFNPQAAFALLANFKVRNCFIPPTALRMMRAVAQPARRFDLKLRTIASGGETLGTKVYDWAQAELGLTISEFYGQTECNIVVGSSVAAGVSRRGFIGRPVPGHEVGIIDAQGKILPPGQPGQIAVRRPDPVMFLEYWREPQATADKFIDDWMVTGDQGIVDDDGYIGFVGRDDDVITSAGYRIGPGEIEDCLIGHPAVALAAVIGKPDTLRTQIVKAFIVLAEGFEAGDKLVEEIQHFVRERLAAHEYPREIVFLDALPLTTTGKVIRRQLREIT